MDALSFGRHVVRISFAKSLTNRNVLLQELCQIEPGRHVVRISSFEDIDKHDNSVLELSFRLVWKDCCLILSAAFLTNIACTG